MAILNLKVQMSCVQFIILSVCSMISTYDCDHRMPVVSWHPFVDVPKRWNGLEYIDGVLRTQ